MYIYMIQVLEAMYSSIISTISILFEYSGKRQKYTFEHKIYDSDIYLIFWFYFFRSHRGECWGAGVVHGSRLIQDFEFNNRNPVLQERISHITHALLQDTTPTYIPRVARHIDTHQSLSSCQRPRWTFMSIVSLENSEKNVLISFGRVDIRILNFSISI